MIAYIKNSPKLFENFARVNQETSTCMNMDVKASLDVSWEDLH